MIPDPFAIPDFGFEPYEGPQSTAEFSQPDLTLSTLKSWLGSRECQGETGQLPGVRMVQRLVLPAGVYLQPASERGVWKLFIPAKHFRWRVYEGTCDELLTTLASLHLTEEPQHNPQEQ